MGTSRSVDEFFVKWERLKDGVQKDGPETVGAIAQFMEDRALDLAKDEVGSDLVFRNNKRRKLGVGYKVSKNNVGATAEVRAKGPFGWLEYGVPSHAIVPGGKTKKFRAAIGAGLGGAAGPALPVAVAVGLGLNKGKGRGKLMVWTGNGGKKAAAFYITKSGELPEKNTWSNAVEQTTRSAGEIADRQMVRTLTDVFR